MGKRPSPEPPDLGLVSATQDERMVGAEQRAAAAGPRKGKGGGAAGAIREYLRSLASPLVLSHEEARAAFYFAGMQRQHVTLDDPRLEEIAARIAPPLNLTQSILADIAEQATGRPTAASGLRRIAQEMRDEGLLHFAGRGQYFVPSPQVIWPDTDNRAVGFVLKKDGSGYYAI